MFDWVLIFIVLNTDLKSQIIGIVTTSSVSFLYNESHNLIKTDTLVFAHFLEYIKLVFDGNMDEEIE